MCPSLALPRIALLFLTATLTFAACRPSPSAIGTSSDGPWLLAPESRNDLVHLEDDHTSLRARFGDSVVKFIFLRTGNQDTVGATILFGEDSTRRVEVVWRDPIQRRWPGIVRIGRGSTWRIAPGIGIGTNLSAIDSLNHRAVTMGGYATNVESSRIIDWGGGTLDTLWRRGDTLGVAVALDIAPTLTWPDKSNNSFRKSGDSLVIRSAPIVTAISVRPRATVTTEMKAFATLEPPPIDSCDAIDKRPRRPIDPSDSFNLYLATLPKTLGDWKKTERVDFGSFFLTLPVGSERGYRLPGCRYNCGISVDTGATYPGYDPVQQSLIAKSSCEDDAFLDPGPWVGCGTNPVGYRIKSVVGALYQSSCGDCIDWHFTTAKENRVVTLSVSLDDREDFGSSTACRILHAMFSMDWKDPDPH